jgi:hypothetical protein
VTTIHAQIVGNQVLLSRDELDCLVELARKTSAVNLQISADDVPTVALMRLAEQGGAFDFWREEGENVYSIQDGEAV